MSAVSRRKQKKADAQVLRVLVQDSSGKWVDFDQPLETLIGTMISLKDESGSVRDILDEEFLRDILAEKESGNPQTIFVQG